MDSSQVFGAAEECHSSESGWTMYIGSPVSGEEDDSDPNSHDADGEYEDFVDENHEYNHDENSDDSMASDASSGPSHREQPWEIKKAGRHQAKVDRDHCSNYKAKKEVKKNRHENGKEKKDEPEVAGKGAKYIVQGSKVRKNLGCGKEIK